MSTVVLKYGGSSVASIDHIQNVASQVASYHSSGKKVVVVVSAMQGETDRLIKLAKEISDEPDRREYDVLVSSGEQVSSALLAMCLRRHDIEAKSLMGHQVCIRTDAGHGCAKINHIESSRIHELLNKRCVVVVAGFQGMDEQGEVTTLGRGGSDLTAVALAAALKADCCEIYTDVDGVYTADPQTCRDARLIKKISYEEMLELASAGAKVLQTRCVKMAMNYDIPIHVRNSFAPEGEGTMVTREDKSMEATVVSGVSLDKSEAKISIQSVPTQNQAVAAIFGALAKQDVNVDMIVQNETADAQLGLAFTVPKDQEEQAYRVVKDLQSSLELGEIERDARIAKVSIIGVGMRSHSGVAAKMFSALATENIRIHLVATSEIRVSCVIEEKYAELALQTLHEVFGLAAESQSTSA